MRVATTLCRAQIGLNAPLVHVEVHLGSGLPVFAIVGLPAAAVRESKQRVRAAIENCGFEFPAGRITVNLAPADLPKEGARFDLAIALGILQASGQIAPQGHPERDASARRELYGELSLSGAIKPVKGLLLAAAEACEARHDILIPRANAGEARIAVRDVAMLAVDHLLEACAAVRGERPAAVAVTAIDSRAPPALELRDVRGQYQAKRALIVAAAGAHSLLRLRSRRPQSLWHTAGRVRKATNGTSLRVQQMVNRSTGHERRFAPTTRREGPAVLRAARARSRHHADAGR